jgi:hypothetical protein
MALKKRVFSRRSKKYKKSRKTRRRHRRSHRGGNYATDITTRTLEGFPMKSYNQVVTTVPGRGVMSAAAYLQLEEDRDRNGTSGYYD